MMMNDDERFRGYRRVNRSGRWDCNDHAFEAHVDPIVDNKRPVDKAVRELIEWADRQAKENADWLENAYIGEMIKDEQL